MSEKNRRLLPMTAIFLTVLLDMLAFGMFIPDLQLRGRSLVLAANLPSWIDQGFLIGFAVSIFSIAQFIVAPGLGRLSDRVGRRPVLIITCLFCVIGALLYSQATGLWLLLFARALQGAGGANLGVAYAYVADISAPDQRSRLMGQLGAAFGIGFLFGPPLGALLLEQPNGIQILALVSAGFGILNLLFLIFLLPESIHLRPTEAAETKRPNIWQALLTPGLGVLLFLFFSANLAFANLESTFYLLAADQWQLKASEATIVLIVVGVVQTLTQGVLVPRVLPLIGEENALRIAYLIQSPIMALVPFSTPWVLLIGGCTLLSMAGGLAQPSLNSLISQRAPAEMSGGIFGVTQSLGAVARILGPWVGNVLYARSFWLPYLIAGILLLIPLAGSLTLRRPPRSAAVS